MLRTPDVTTFERDERWIIEPLLDAGLHLDEVRELMFRTSVADLATAGRDELLDAVAFLEHRAPAVRAAWIQTIDRMLRSPAV